MRRTLTNLYNQCPTWLDLAHKKLDEAVLDAEIIEDLQASLEELQAMSDDLAQTPGDREGEGDGDD